jgi:hypothetical protein
VAAAADDSLKKPQTSPGRCQLRFLIKCARAFFQLSPQLKSRRCCPNSLNARLAAVNQSHLGAAVENFNHRGNVNFFIVRDVKSSLLRSIIKSVPPLAGGGVEKSLKEAVRDLYLCVGSIKS